MADDVTPEVSALAINVTIPEDLRWTDTRRGEAFTLTTLNVRLLPGRTPRREGLRPADRRRPRYLRVVPRCPTDPSWWPWSPRRHGRRPCCGQRIAGSADPVGPRTWPSGRVAALA